MKKVRSKFGRAAFLHTRTDVILYLPTFFVPASLLMAEQEKTKMEINFGSTSRPYLPWQRVHVFI